MYQHVGNSVVLETLANRYLLMIKIVHGRIVARSHHAFPFLLEHLSHLPHAHHYPALDLLLVLDNLAEPHCVALAPPIEWVIESPVVVLKDDNGRFNNPFDRGCQSNTMRFCQIVEDEEEIQRRVVMSVREMGEMLKEKGESMV